MSKSSSYGFSRPIPEPNIPPLIFFDTSRQQTRLVAEDGQLRIELEEKASGEVKSYPIEGSTVTVDPRDHERTGLLHVGNRRNWLYAKRLFSGPEDLAAQVALRVEGS